jgi:predicted ATPase
MDQSRRFILTGTAGVGKSSVIDRLKVVGYIVVSETATDLIAQKQREGVMRPWINPTFIDEIIAMQRQRQEAAFGALQFYDRSPFCTMALSRYLNYLPSSELLGELKRCKDQQIYQNKVFFLENLGFIENTDVRQISYQDSLFFEKIHMDVYHEYGFEIIMVKRDSILNRCDYILRAIRN